MSDYRNFGPAFSIRCSLDEDDYVGTVSVADGETPVGVCLETGSVFGEHVVPTMRLLLAPSDARKLAAEILNAADRVDGTVPLAFYERPAGDE